METQKTQNSQSNIEKKKWNWRNQAPCLQTILQSYNHQNSIELEQKQKYRSVEQHRKPRNKPMGLRPINLQKRRQEYTMEIKANSSVSSAVETGQFHVQE